jgi:hypothetical protein
MNGENGKLISIGFGLLLLFPTCAQSGFSQSQEVEPEKPTIAETVVYINANASNQISLNGTVLKTTMPPPGDCLCVYEVDLLNLQSVVRISNLPQFIFIKCLGSADCLTDTSHAGGTYIGHHDSLEIKAKDAQIAPRLANALQHLIRLVQKNAHPSGNDPFAR